MCKSYHTLVLRYLIDRYPGIHTLPFSFVDFVEEIIYVCEEGIYVNPWYVSIVTFVHEPLVRH